MNPGLLDEYKSMVGKLGFFEPTPSGNFKWQLSNESTDDEIQRLMDVIQTIANKINE